MSMMPKNFVKGQLVLENNKLRNKVKALEAKLASVRQFCSYHQVTAAEPTHDTILVRAVDVIAIIGES